MKKEIFVSRGCVNRLLLGLDAYEVLPKRCNLYRIGKVYPLCGISDTYVKVLSSELINARSINDAIWCDMGVDASKREDYVVSRCGKGAWLMSLDVCLVRLSLVDGNARGTALRKDFLRKIWIRNSASEGAFISKDS